MMTLICKLHKNLKIFLGKYLFSNKCFVNDIFKKVSKQLQDFIYIQIV